MEARLGKYSLTKDDEIGSTIHPVISEIIIHPDWKYDQDSYDADIAILKLFLLNAIDFNSFVRPICLPEQMDLVVTGNGTTVGWSKSAKSNDVNESTPSAVEQPVVDGNTCYTTDYNLAKYSSSRMFCGGSVSQGEASCSADSGGFYFLDERSIWTIRGISSGGVKDAAGKCEASAHTLHTNVAKFSDWILDKTTDWTKAKFKCSKFNKER